MTRVAVIDGGERLTSLVRSLLDPDVEVLDVHDAGDTATLATAAVIVAGPACASREGIARLRALRLEVGATPLVLAFDRDPAAPVREVVAVAADAMVDPADTQELRAALETALSQVRTSAGDAHQLVSVVSATGGCGKTLIATNLAVALARWSTASVALVDLDLQFGRVDVALGMRARTTWSALSRVEPAEVAENLGGVLTTHESGLHVLPAPDDPVVADRLDDGLVRATLEALRATHDVVIVDTATGLAEATLEALDLTDAVVLPVCLDVGAIRRLQTMERTLEQLGIQRATRHVVLNGERPGVGLTGDEVEEALARSFAVRFPYSVRVAAAANSDHPLALDASGPSFVASVADLLTALVAPVHHPAIAANRPAAEASRWPLPNRPRRSRRARPERRRTRDVGGGPSRRPEDGGSS